MDHIYKSMEPRYSGDAVGQRAVKDGMLMLEARKMLAISRAPGRYSFTFTSTLSAMPDTMSWWRNYTAEQWVEDIKIWREKGPIWR